MKRIIAFFLILSLCAALIPAVAEDSSLVGTWYVTAAKIDNMEVQVIDPEVITLTLNEDGTFVRAIASLGLSDAGTWSSTESVLSLTSDNQTTEVRIVGDTLDYVVDTDTYTLSRTPAEPVSLPAAVAAESMDAFNGTWTPYAAITSGLYMILDDENVAVFGRIQIENGSISFLFDSGNGEYAADGPYEGTFADGILTMHDNSALPTTNTFALMEDGSLNITTIIDNNAGETMELIMIYRPVIS